MNNQTKKDLNALIGIMQRKVLGEDLKSLASMNCGSYHKTKDEIVNQVCGLAQYALQFQNFCLNCMHHIIDGGTFQSYMDGQLHELTRTNQPQMDRDYTKKMLERLGEDVIEFYDEP